MSKCSCGFQSDRPNGLLRHIGAMKRHRPNEVHEEVKESFQEINFCPRCGMDLRFVKSALELGRLSR